MSAANVVSRRPILVSLIPDGIAFASRKGVGNLKIVRSACSPADKVIE